MRLPERFALVIEGTLWRVRRRSVVVPNEVAYAIARLLDGLDAAPSTFEANGLRVTIEECTDQSEEPEDDFALRSGSLRR